MVKGGQIQTRESFLYGKIETMMKPAHGSGIISSFFTFSDKPGFQKDWNEIDFEWLGRNTNTIDTNIIQTINHYTDKNINVQHTTLNKRSTDIFWKLCIEWSPDKIVWKVNDIIIRELTVKLNKPMKLMMNIWASSDKNWSGEFNGGVLPQQSTYEYVRISTYENGKFIFKLQDDFNTLNDKLWYVAKHTTGDTLFVKENVSIKDNKLVLTLK